VSRGEWLGCTGLDEAGNRPTFIKLAPVTVATRAIHLALEKGNFDLFSSWFCSVSETTSRLVTDSAEVGASTAVAGTAFSSGLPVPAFGTIVLLQNTGNRRPSQFHRSMFLGTGSLNVAAWGRICRIYLTRRPGIKIVWTPVLQGSQACRDCRSEEPVQRHRCQGML